MVDGNRMQLDELRLSTLVFFGEQSQDEVCSMQPRLSCISLCYAFVSWYAMSKSRSFSELEIISQTSTWSWKQFSLF